MQDSSNPPTLVGSPPIEEDIKYLYASNANVSNFVSVKLSGDNNYRIWKTQMLCLMKSHNMVGLVDDKIKGPRTSSKEIMDQYDNLLKGWIFGSISENLLNHVIDLELAKEVWEKLKFINGPTISSQIGYADSATEYVEAKAESSKKDRVSAERKTNISVVSANTNVEDIDAAFVELGVKDTHNVPNEVKLKIKDKMKIQRNKYFRKALMKKDWWKLKNQLIEDKGLITEALNSDGNTILHIAVGIGLNRFVSEILSLIEEGVQLSTMLNLDGSTPLHIAAIVGNTEAAKLLIKKDRNLLQISDYNGDTPLVKAYENMHLETIEYLLKATKNDEKNKKKSSPLVDSISPGAPVGVNLLVNAISAKQYDLATNLVKNFPEFVVENDSVMMAIARTFPSGLDYWEALIYPITDTRRISRRILKATRGSFKLLAIFWNTVGFLWDLEVLIISKIMAVLVFMLFAPMLILAYIIRSAYLLILVVHFSCSMFYLLLWKVATRVVPPIQRIEKKKKDLEEAKTVLKLLCDEIDLLEFPDAHPRYYTGPILEAARQNTYEVVSEILMRCPEAIRYKDKNGYDIIQLAVIHRSERIYNLIYIIGERKSVYKMIEDSSGNNMLHLAGRLAPSHKLKRGTGAALQLQRELQWREEVEKLVFPAYITKENNYMETPDMVFTKEHETLVKEGEEWMKVVAESCSITAALITTIVFAAAITVPGGNNETGFPLFRDDIAFTIFVVSDAISLFASSTSLLVFLSILTGRFAEQDFLVILPRRLISGLFTLMLSTTTMMVAFGATLFMVFCRKKPSMLAPICVLAFLPIASFATLQIPLIVDLFRSTYGHIFGKTRNNKINGNKFNPDIRLFFGK